MIEKKHLKKEKQKISLEDIGDTNNTLEIEKELSELENIKVKNKNELKMQKNKSKSFGIKFKKSKKEGLIKKKKIGKENKKEEKTKKKKHEYKQIVATILPEIKGKNIEVLDTIPIKEFYSYVRITYDKIKHEYLYSLIEPEISEEEKKYLEFIEDTLFRTLEYELREIDNVEGYLKENVIKAIKDYNLKIDELSKEKILYYVYRNFVGYGKIDILMKDLMIEDISCDGPNIPLFLYHRAYESIKTNIKFKDDDELDSFVIRLVQRCGKHISVANPIIDATIPDGSRLQVTLSHEVTTKGSSFTIRKFREDPLTPPDLVRYNTMSAEIISYLWLAVQYGESIICSGGTASGKTSTLNAIALFIPPQMKIVSIEDTKELNLPHENWIAGLTRAGFGVRSEGGSAMGEIDMYELMRAALRQRPQYMIVGEVRGKETYTLFQAMATGHTTYSTMHADSAQSIVHRLESPPINLPRILLSALNIIILQGQVRLGNSMVRRVKEIIEIVGIERRTNEIITNTVFKWSPVTDSFKFYGQSSLFDKIGERTNITIKEVLDEWKQRADIIKWMQKNEVRSYLEVAKIVTAYYKEPENTIKMVRNELHKKENTKEKTKKKKNSEMDELFEEEIEIGIGQEKNLGLIRSESHGVN